MKTGRKKPAPVPKAEIEHRKEYLAAFRARMADPEQRKAVTKADIKKALSAQRELAMMAELGDG